MFRVRIFKVEHYMSAPISGLDVTYSDFRKSCVKHVPVIRVFGTTPSGEKTCVHVHGVFPYICIPYDGSEPYLKLSYQLAASLDKAINIASGYSTSNAQHVYKVVLVSGIPFYGFHQKRYQFLKIYFYKPSVIKQAVQLLQNGAILNKIFEPHEAHIPFILQFFIDFNLYGMSFIELNNVKYRKTAKSDLHHDIPAGALLPVSAVSLSQYEIDVLACDIINRPSSQGNAQIVNPGLTAIWEDENRRRAMTEGTPLKAPQLHSQRPPLKSSASEVFYLRKLYDTLDNQVHPGDRSLLSGEPVSLSNKSYPIEEPANTPALDASFVSMHTQHSPDITAPCDIDNLNDTIVDEDLALLNVSISQRLTQTLEKSLAFDPEDLELLDVLETLADTRAVTVDNDSELGSQASRGKSVPFSAPNEEHCSDGEENWHDESVVAEEDEVMKLLDLSMPYIDEKDILINEATSSQLEEKSQHPNIPQVDGACDNFSESLPRRKCRRKSIIIPQVDGVDDLPFKNARRSLGMRRRKSIASVDGQANSDFRYSPSGHLIFNTRKKPNVISGASLQDNTSHVPPRNGVDKSVPPCSQPVESTWPGHTLEAVYQKGRECGQTSGTSSLPLLVAGSESAVQVVSQPTKPGVEPDALLCLVSLPSQQCTIASSSSGDNIILSSVPLPILAQENIQSPEVCCSATSAACACDVNNSDHDCPDAFIEMLARKNKDFPLQGDPSLYPQPPTEREKSLSDNISASASAPKICPGPKFPGKPMNQGESSSQVRMSLQLASHRTSQETPCMPETQVHNACKTPENESFCSDMDFQDVLPEVTNTMLQELQEDVFEWSCNAISSCSDSEVNQPVGDSEMNHFSSALQNDHVQQVLQTSPDSTEKPSVGFRNKFLHFLQNQESPFNNKTLLSTSSCNVKDIDPVPDTLLKRGVMAKPGRPPSQGLGRKSNPLKKTKNKDIKKAEKQRRKRKLSLAEQKRMKKTSVHKQEPSILSEVKSTLQLRKPYIVLQMLTLGNINAVCREFKVGLRDKSALPGELLNQSFKIKANISKSDILCGGKSRRSYPMKQSPRPEVSISNQSCNIQNIAIQKQSMACFSNNSQEETILKNTVTPVVNSTGFGALSVSSAQMQPTPRHSGRKKKAPLDSNFCDSNVYTSSASCFSNNTLQNNTRNFEDTVAEENSTMSSQDNGPLAESTLISVDYQGLSELSVESPPDRPLRRSLRIKTPYFNDSATSSGRYDPTDQVDIVHSGCGRSKKNLVATGLTGLCTSDGSLGKTALKDSGDKGAVSKPLDLQSKSKQNTATKEETAVKSGIACGLGVPTESEASSDVISLAKKHEVKEPCMHVLNPDLSSIQCEDKLSNKFAHVVTKRRQVSVVWPPTSTAVPCKQDASKREEISKDPLAATPRMSLTIVRDKLGGYSTRPGVSEKSSDLYSRKHGLPNSIKGSFDRKNTSVNPQSSPKLMHKLSVACNMDCEGAESQDCHVAEVLSLVTVTSKKDDNFGSKPALTKASRTSAHHTQKSDKPLLSGSQGDAVTNLQPINLNCGIESDSESSDSSFCMKVSKRNVGRAQVKSSSSEEELGGVSDSINHNKSNSFTAVPQNKSSILHKDLQLSSDSSDDESKEPVRVPHETTNISEFASEGSNNLLRNKSSAKRKAVFSSSLSEGDTPKLTEPPAASLNRSCKIRFTLRPIEGIPQPSRGVKNSSPIHLEEEKVEDGLPIGSAPKLTEPPAASLNRSCKTRFTLRPIKGIPQPSRGVINSSPIHLEEEKVEDGLPIGSALADVKSRETVSVEVKPPLKRGLVRSAASTSCGEVAAFTKTVKSAKLLPTHTSSLSKKREVSLPSSDLSKHVPVQREPSTVIEHAADICSQPRYSCQLSTLPNTLKDYKIPKKSVQSKVSENHSDQASGNANPSRLDITCALTSNSPKKNDHTSGIESDLFISLDTSDIVLHLSSDDGEEKTEPSSVPSSHHVSNHGQCALGQSTSSSDGQLTVVKGDVHTETSYGLSLSDKMDFSSASEVLDRADHQKILEGKLSFEIKQTKIKNQSNDFPPIIEDSEASDLPPVLSVEEIPKSVSQWFAQPYAPWSFWSPNISPNASHHFFSPPRAVSPDKTDPCGGKTAALNNHCMSNKEVSITNSSLNLSLGISQDTCHNIPSIHTILKNTEDEEETFSLINSSVLLNPEHNEHGSSKTDQSLFDPFCEMSTLLDKERRNEEEQHGLASSPVILNAGLNSIECLSLEEATDCLHIEDGKRLVLVQCGVHETSEKSGVQVTYSSKESCSNSCDNQDTLRNYKSSGESSDLPCGQNEGGENLRAVVKGLCPLSNAFKPVQKPPSRQEVMSTLSSFKIPEVVPQEPFFSNVGDVKRKLEVGGNVLDLLSKRCIHLEEFHSHIEKLQGLVMQQKKLSKCHRSHSQAKTELNKYCHPNAREVLMTLIRKPPSVQEVKLWCKAREITMGKLVKSTNKDDGYEDIVKKESIPSSQTKQGEDFDLFHKSPILSLGSGSLRTSQTETIQSSTPNVHAKKVGHHGVSFPLLTPISHLKNQPSDEQTRSISKQYLKKLSPALLPSVVENDEDLGVHSLEVEASVVSVPSECVQNLKTSQRDMLFGKEVSGSSFRHVSDASACEIKGLNASPGFKMVLENLQSAKTVKEYQFLTILTVEVHVCTCGTLNPDPERDPIRAIFYSIWNDVPENFKTPSERNGIIATNFNESNIPVLNRCGVEGNIEYASNETSIFSVLISLVRQWDPDILAGFETEMQSWGYILQRANVLGLNLIQELSRVPCQTEGKEWNEVDDNNGLSGLNVTGRIVLDVWRLFRSEVALQSYTFENLMYHILHQRVSHYSFESLSRWWENPTNLLRWITVQYYQRRVQGVMKLLDQLDIIGRTSELARLFGIQFFEVLSRGSQFRVESMMLRLAKPLNYIPVSPSVQQRAHMRAPECLPLIMEPESRFYSDPLIVLDFQSLYPSMIIAYNYCFSTCLGRVEHLGKSSHFEFGCSELRVTHAHLEQLRGNITVSPCGVAFVSKNVRQGILPRMLEEILEARLAVKQSMKYHKDDHTLQRVLHARQLGLKLIANVTYGYTSANFSGRMPCIEVGDSVVSKGRETLERAISLVHSNCEWGARVVYGDTDSLFVLVPGRSRQEAFRIGAEIASAVTQDNPSPVKLKLEKVYQPSILQTKKRYVGFMYESSDQKQPTYEAKGIETVRRDGCPAVSKMLEKSLRILFETRDVSSVKSYVSRQFSKLLAGRANIQDLIYAREYRGKGNYRPGACVPALELTKRWLRHDRRAEPRIGERVPYVIVNGPPGSSLIQLVRHPRELLSDPSLRYNAVYYVTRAIIPPLARCFSLIGADVPSWYADLPRKNQLSLPNLVQTGLKKTISQYFSTIECVSCGVWTHGGVCMKCRANPQYLTASLMNRVHTCETIHNSIMKICQSCVGRSDQLDCNSLDCPITYRRHQSSQKYSQSQFLTNMLSDCGIKSNLS